MIKQLLVIGTAATMFIAVWVLVIFEFNVEREPLALDFSTEIEPTYDRVIDFPDTVKYDQNEALDSLESETTLEPINNEEKISLEPSERSIDLRMFDFSDVSTKEGIPIAAILKKLELE